MIRAFSILLAGSLLVPLAVAKAPPPGTGAGDVPVNVLFMLDTSYSMLSSVNFGASEVVGDSLGNIYVSIPDSHNIQKYDVDNYSLPNVGSGFGEGEGEFNNPTSLAVDHLDNLFVADRGNERVQVFDPDGVYLTSFEFADGDAPKSISLDRAQDPVLYALTGDAKLYAWDLVGGNYTTTILEATVGADLELTAISVSNGSLYTIGSQTLLGSTQFTVFQYDLKDLADGPVAEAEIVADYSKDILDVYDIETIDGAVLATYGVDDGNYKDTETKALSFDLANSSSSYFLQRSSNYDDATPPYLATGKSLKGDFFLTGPSGIERMTPEETSSNKCPSSGSCNFRAPYYWYNDQFEDNSRTDVLKKVIKKLASSSDLTSSAHFGLMKWSSSAKMLVNISKSGASEIYDMMDDLEEDGYTYLNLGMSEAKSYLEGSNSPIDPSIDCQKTILLVFSDGAWGSTTQVENQASDFLEKGIETYVVGFEDDLDAYARANYEDLATAGGTYPDSPLYASDWSSLYQAMSALISKAIADQQSFTAPTIMPSTSGGSNHLLQASFKFQQENQWRGKLKKLELTDDGMIGSETWEAGKLLEDRSPDDRNIWTVMEWLGGTTQANNFTAENRAKLGSALYENAGAVPASSEVEQLINFVRGYDAFDEDEDGDDSDVRWPLGDIYHSVPIVVGSPSHLTTTEASKENTEAYFRAANNYDNFKATQRDEMIYVGANDGMLHAFDSDTGAERWAFIPPMVLGSLSEMKGSGANTSRAIYAVDGSPSVSDIYVGGQWKTVLIAGLGRGGNGYFALDVTDPGAPEFLWAVENRTDFATVRYWGSDGSLSSFNSGTVTSEYDFFSLAEAWSKPQIVLLEIDGIQKHVAVIGGGYNSGTSSGLGSSVFVLDMTNGGKILQEILLSGSTSDVVNSVPADVTLITPDTTTRADYKGAMAYVTDTQGKLWKINLTDQGSLYSSTLIFDGQASGLADRQAFFSPSAAISNTGQLWLYYGTGDMQNLGDVTNTISNRVYGIKDTQFPRFIDVADHGTIDDLSNTTQAGAMCPTSSELGWYNELDATEKVTGKITIHNETLFVSRYTPDADDVCMPGDGRLTEHDYLCGNRYANGTHELGKGIPTQATYFNGKIYVGISGSQEETVLGENFTKSDNVIVGEASQNAFSAGSAVIEGWREIF